jgi:uncharacterized protein YfbU (UPF0304 family)
VIRVLDKDATSAGVTTTMKLSDGEKLILVMLRDIYKHGEVKGEIDPDFVQRMIEGEQTWALHWKYPGIPFEPKETPRLVDEVRDILEMWWLIESTYDKLGATDRQQIETAVGSRGKHPKFPGFDGDNEGEHRRIARILINDLDQYTGLKERGDGLNSHMPVLDGYRRMLRILGPMRGAIGPDGLSAGQLIEILTARIHPDN